MIAHVVFSTAGSDCTQIANTVYFLFVQKTKLDLVTRFR